MLVWFDIEAIRYIVVIEHLITFPPISNFLEL